MKKSLIQSEVSSQKSFYRKTTLSQIFILCLVSSFITLAVFAKMYSYFSLDVVVTKSIQQFHPLWFDLLMKAISAFGYYPYMNFLVGAITFVIFLFGFRLEAVFSVLSSLGASFLVDVVKSTIHRPRPEHDVVSVFTRLQDFSFPSGHVLTYIAFFGFLLFLTQTLFKPSFFRKTLSIFWLSLILLIGPSRIYLGAHWASDVLGAYLLGSLWLLVIITLFKYVKIKRENLKKSD